MLTQTSLLVLASLAIAAPFENLTEGYSQIFFGKGSAQGKLGGQVVSFHLETNGDFVLLKDKNNGQIASPQTITQGYSPGRSASDTGKAYDVELSPYVQSPTLLDGELYKDTIEIAGKVLQDYPIVVAPGPSSVYVDLDLSFNGTLAKQLGRQLQFIDRFDEVTSLVDTNVEIGSFGCPGVFHKVNAANEIENLELTYANRTSKTFQAVLDFQSGVTRTPSGFSDSFPFVGLGGSSVRCDVFGDLELKIEDQKLKLPRSSVFRNPPIGTECVSRFQESSYGDLPTVHLGSNILEHLVVTYDFEKGGIWIKLAE